MRGKGSMARNGSLFGVFALLAATLCWAGNYLVGAAAVDTIPPLDLTAMRWAIALVPLFLLAQFVERPDWGSVLRAWPVLLLAAVLGLLAYNLLLYSALERTTAINASLINAFNPALISIAAALLLRQKPTPLSALGILLALLGVVWVLCDGDPAALVAHGFGVGDLIMVGAIVVWTFYTLLSRRTADIPPIASTAVQALAVVIVLTPFVLLDGGPRIPSEPGPSWALLFIGLFPSVASYALWNAALRTIPPARAGVFLNLITVFTVLISVVFLGSPLTPAQGLGGFVVLGAVALANHRAFRRAA